MGDTFTCFALRPEDTVYCAEEELCCGEDTANPVCLKPGQTCCVHNIASADNTFTGCAEGKTEDCTTPPLVNSQDTFTCFALRPEDTVYCAEEELCCGAGWGD